VLGHEHEPPAVRQREDTIDAPTEQIVHAGLSPGVEVRKEMRATA
jgi:hypothetical protein